MIVEIMTKSIHIRLDNRPSLFEEKAIEIIRTRGFIIREIKNDPINFFKAKWQIDVIKAEQLGIMLYKSNCIVMPKELPRLFLNS